tara:strand:- start:3415 stop:3696 length:282 start_codon:yes stop_codon:yes gene_type:complete
MDSQEKKNILKELRKLKKAELFERLASERGHCLNVVEDIRKDVEADRLDDVVNGANSLVSHSLPYLRLFYNDPVISKKMGLKRPKTKWAADDE